MSNSPFKFLNAYEKQDKAFFFGREKESKELYELTYDSRLILLYGASGTGKTSLIKCGLANKFRDSRWLGLYIRRNINLLDSIREALINEIDDPTFNSDAAQSSTMDLIKEVYREKFKPIYLLLDQFEELFILNPNEEEQAAFFQTLKDIQDSDISCSVIIIMREEFIAHLWEYEKMIPYLFDHRYRVEKMRYTKIEEIVEKTLAQFEKNGTIDVQNKNLVAEQIVDKLTEDNTDPELTYLQVYLDRLYELASNENEKKPIFNTNLVEQLDSFGDIIGDFLQNQIKLLENQLGEGKEGIPLRILGALVTDAQTKKVVSPSFLEHLRQELNITKKELETCIEVFENMRIIRRYD